MRRALALILTIALFITLLPTYVAPQTASAAGSYFLFPNEHDTPGNARIVSTESISLQGTINGVVGSSISYNVKQVTASGTVLNTTEEITTGIATTGDNKITVSNLILFPGLNKITFKGIAGSSEVSESIYIDYRNSPMLYDMKITFENKDYEMPENQPTMLYSTAPVIQDKGQIVITGKAPNATKVTIVINGRSYDFNVSTSTNESRFSTSQLSIDKGINIITFKVLNGGQVVETTREVAFYNGEVTYYNLKIKDSQTTPQIVNLENNLNFLTPSVATGQIKIDGTAIIPLPLRDLPTNPNNTIDPNGAGVNFSTELANRLKMELQEGNGTTQTLSPTVGTVTYTPSTIDASTKFISVNFSYTLPDLTFDESNRIRFIAPNNAVFNYSNWTSFTVRNSNVSYIYDINYLSGFDNSMTNPATNASRILGLQGADIPSEGVNVFSMPMAVEILVGNYTVLGGTHNDLFKMNGIDEDTTGAPFKQIYSMGSTPLSEIVYRTINGQSVPFLRTFVQINELPKSGTNTIGFALNRTANVSTETKQIIAKLLYGPHMKFDKVVDGMKIEFDSVRESKDSLINKLGELKGQLFNVVNSAEIVYGTSVFLYINNVEIPLAPDGTISKFKPLNLGNSDATLHGAARDRIFGVLNKAGENTIKFVFRSAKNNYENTLKFTIVPSNLPVIPAPNTDGVYPYSQNLATPLPNDPSFPKQGTVFTTKEAYYNVYGTFDFVDLGSDFNNNSNTAHAALGDKQNYIVTIASPNWKTNVVWNLGMEFTPTRKGVPLAGYENTPFNKGTNSNPTTADADVAFYYDVDGQYFYYKILSQVMPDDGSSMVYVTTVFNAGEAGPRATHRLEIDSVSIPYTIQKPLKEETITNQNFVEVIISSPGADSVTIDKQVAEKVTYINYSEGDENLIEAFRLVVKDLRAGKETGIEFEITRGDDTIEQELIVKYVPTNIPGAQMMETMKSSHKLFNNALSLSFGKNTQLIRPKYNNSSGHATQVYNGNDILFAIANPNDGIVDRHLYDSQPPNYSANSQAEGNLHIGYRFQDQARQFIKASPLFWIDAGLADNPDPSSPAYDPITTGLDPFPFPNLVGKHTGTFASRWNQFDRELIPSAPGSLTITYDSNVVQSAGTTITVFRFDPYNSTWENIGGVVDEKKRTVTVPFTKFGYYVAVKLTRGYNDITDHPYAREAMDAIFAKGIMNAIDPIGVFGGDRYVTRGEFTRMIVRAMDLPLNYEGAHHFSYYPETITNANNSSAIYDYRYIETAARAGIVNGKRPGFFDEDVELTRQEASVILARALQLKLETDSTKAKKSLDKIFKDSGTFDFYSIPSVLAIQKKAFIQGKLINPLEPKEGSVFEPKARLLRSDAAIIMSRVMNDMDKLPKIYN
ncbi:S-layer homology domain-containing protein [Paenibacillus sp. LHD-117]|uniref:S-layer homology domain-containing protein n=1 Tax=Paenibacillus sp. LHD-117 TaxID=3071412 RepID=UPI0027DED474|nr:S-layer homology domain-containing protein [Paenibacillus sp. LHD-117]MDQ6420917.1 S-layer homology domain-containing protein [Paenibacillus sp. LHD-117]